MKDLFQAVSEILIAVDRTLKAAAEAQRAASVRVHQLEAENAALRAQLIALREERRLQGALGFVPRGPRS